MGVRLPQRLVVVKGFGEKPMLLLTGVAGTDSRKSLWQIVEGYTTRWRTADAIRFIKQSYRLEGIRLLDYARLFNRCGRWCRERAARGADEMQQELPLFASG